MLRNFDIHVFQCMREVKVTGLRVKKCPTLLFVTGASRICFGWKNSKLQPSMQSFSGEHFQNSLELYFTSYTGQGQVERGEGERRISFLAPIPTTITFYSSHYASASLDLKMLTTYIKYSLNWLTQRIHLRNRLAKPYDFYNQKFKLLEKSILCSSTTS